jgi:hypothetical protein
VFRERCCLVLHPHYIEGREQAANEARDADPSLRKKPKKANKAADLASVPYEAYSKVSSHRCTILEIMSQLQIRGVNPGHTTKKDALLRLWETNSDLQDKRAAAAVVPRPAHAAAAGGDPRPPAADDQGFDLVDPFLPGALPRASSAAAGGGSAAAVQPPPGPRVMTFFGGRASAGSLINVSDDTFVRVPFAPLNSAAAGGGDPRPAAAASEKRFAGIVKTRVCSVCKKVGHQKNKCPMRNIDLDV